MIVAKTRLRKIPETCTACNLSRKVWGSKFCGPRCRFVPVVKKKGQRPHYEKPEWCPLMEVEL